MLTRVEKLEVTKAIWPIDLAATVSKFFAAEGFPLPV
jgi:hypothetical protein